MDLELDMLFGFKDALFCAKGVLIQGPSLLSNFSQIISPIRNYKKKYVQLIVFVNYTGYDRKLKSFLNGLSNILKSTNLFHTFIIPSKFYKNVTLKYTIPDSPFVSSGRYAFRADLIDPNDKSILASDVTYFEISDAISSKVQEFI